MAFALYGVVVGGDFSAVDGLARSNLTSLDRADGAVLAFTGRTISLVDRNAADTQNLFAIPPFEASAEDLATRRDARIGA